MKKIAIIGSDGRMGKFRKKIMQRYNVDVVGFEAGDDESTITKGFDGYMICTPLNSHKKYLEILLETGKPIFIEKPLLGSLDEVKEIFNHPNSKMIYVAWQRRMHSDYIKVKEKLDAQNGEWTKIHIQSFDNPSPPEHVLGIPNYLFADFMGHDVNELLWMTGGEMPNHISVVTASTQGTKDPNYALVTLEYSNNRIAILEGCTHNPGNYYHQKLEINTPNSVISSLDDKTNYSFPEFYASAFADEVLTFLKVVESDGAHYTNQAEHNIKTAALIEAIINAAKSTTTSTIEQIKEVGKFAVIGNGNFSQYIQSMLKEDTNIQIDEVVTTSSPVDFQDVIMDVDFSRVYICTPDNLHDEQALFAAESGLHILCEKPLSKIDDIINRCSENDRAFMMGFQRRFDDRFIKAFDYARDNREILSSISIISKDPVPRDEDSAFVIRNSLIHDFDTLNMLLDIKIGNAYVEAHSMYVDANGSDISVIMTAYIRKGNGDWYSIPCTITYAKENPTYQQHVVIRTHTETNTFGFEYVPQEGIKVFDSYREAYKKQFEAFMKMKSFDSELAESYRETVNLTNIAVNSLQKGFHLKGDKVDV